MTDSYELIQRLRERISELPAGYISQKNIKGRVQYYRQWNEGNQLKSKYISAGDVDTVRKQIEERKSLEEQLKKLLTIYPETTEDVYETNVVVGRELWDMVESTRQFQKRDLYPQLERCG